ncbi:hypothetical protein FKW77_005653 [Venturia effusa]|uniref:C2H2-type domain-containing protein n=1 Tax=Venturia effusa TaxID=50376 RepID=A0A517LDT0_9PEZI|nr:hypothetical protein FKW77_005653 [Venturia effusa]
MSTNESNGVSAVTTTSQAPQAPSPQSTQAAVNALSQSNSGGDSLICQWQSCGERTTTPEALYDHVCERHVGRKSTNNLNLTCQWGNCRTTTVKRDHITSHIRVHVPLKPHKCDFCGKAFKRPQDLKKHVKTHADDSVLLRSPEPNRGGNGVNGYAGPAGKLVADLQSLAATASGYYPDQQHHISGQPVYYANGGANASAYHGPAATAAQGSAYGPVYYAVSQPQSTNAEYELRKRAAFDALNEFFGDAKQRRIDPTTYYDVGHRLMALNSVQLPMLNGYSSAGHDAYSSSGPQIASAPQVLQQQQYQLPLPNLRTKSDLLNIDQFLEQLQTTVYENSSQAAAAGVSQPGAHYVHPGVNYRSSNSPPQMPSSHISMSSHASSGAPVPSAIETPALTPASSVMSYTSGHSPSSVHSSHTISPIQRPNLGYPTLPGVSAMAEGISGYSASSAAPSGLATAFDHDLRRRYSGGQLQQRAPGDSADSEQTPSPRRRSESTDTMPAIDKLGVRSPSLTNVDPALRSPGLQSEASDQADKAQESWIENVRLIEALRNFVRERLERGEFSTGDEEREDEKTEEDKEAQSLYPVLREVQGENDHHDTAMKME